MNCLVIVILPSLNEGLPRVTLEALACGVHVVGSNIGGILEVIGDENVFDLENSFVQNISDRIVRILMNKIPPSPYSEEFEWSNAINKLLKVFNEANKYESKLTR